MAFVPLATTTTTGLTALTSYFMPVDSTQNVLPYSVVDFVSGAEYYVEGNQYTANNVLKINNASSKLNKVRWIVGGNVVSYYFPWATTDAKATTINFALFPNLSALSLEANSNLNTMDLRGLPMKQIGMWGAGPLSALYITNIEFWNGSSNNWGSIDMRQSALTTVDVSGTWIKGLNVSDNQLSAFDFKLGNDNKNARIAQIAAGRNPYNNFTIDLKNCDTRLLSGVEELKFSRWNNFSQGVQSGNEEPYKLKSITVAGPLSSLYSLDVSQNNLSSLNVPFLPTLKNLFIGERARWFESSNDVPQRTLSANRIELNALTALQYFNMAGIGPISGLNSITGMDRLSSLVYLYVDNNPALNGVAMKDLDLSIIPGRNLQWVSAIQNSSITGINFGNQTFEQRPIPNNPYFPTYRSPTIDLANCNSISALDISPLSGLMDLFYPGATELRTLTLPQDSNAIAAITVNGASYLQDLQVPKYLNYYLSVTYCSALTGLVLDNNYRIGVLYVNSVPSNLQFAGCSALNSIYINNTKTTDIDLSRLSACREFTSISNNDLTNLNLSPAFNALQTLQLSYNSQLPSINIQEYLNLYTVVIQGNKAPSAIISNNVNLKSITFNDDANSPLDHLEVSNNSNLGYFGYSSDNAFSNQASNVSSFDFSNCVSLSSVLIEAANLRTVDCLKDLSNLKVLQLESVPVSSLDALNGLPSLTSFNFDNSWQIYANKPLVNLDTYNNPSGIQLASITYVPTLTSADAFTAGLTTKCRRLTLTNNENLKTLNSAPFSALNLNYINVQYNALSSKDIDSLLISLDRNPVTPGGTKTLAIGNNSRSRSRYSNGARSSLVAKGWSISPGAGTVYKPQPDIYITPLPSTLPFTDTCVVFTSASYLSAAIDTSVYVLSGPGSLANYTLSALSGQGTITLAISTASDTIFASNSALYHVPVTKKNITNKMALSGLNKIYTGNTVTASANVYGFPQISPQIIYLQDGILVTPVNVGYYTVSSYIVDDYYTGTFTNILSVLDQNAFYSIPASATSSAVYFPQICDANKDIVVSFDYAFYGDFKDGYEGFCINFTDMTGEGLNIYRPESTNNTPISGGGPGKALNYTNLTLLSATGNTFTKVNYTGKFKGSLGVGFDASGNFALSSEGVNGYSEAINNSITVRDSEVNKYAVLTRTNNLTAVNNKPVTLFQSTTGAPEYKSVRARLTNFGKNLIVDMKPLTAEKYVNYLTYDLPVALPEALSVAISYSSGNNSPVFKIKNANLNCFFSTLSVGKPYDPDAISYINRSGATDIDAINDFVLQTKGLGIWDKLICWPMRSTLNAGTGRTVYGLGGLTANDGKFVSHWDPDLSPYSPYNYLSFNASLTGYDGSNKWYNTGTVGSSIRFDLYADAGASYNRVYEYNGGIRFSPNYGVAPTGAYAFTNDTMYNYFNGIYNYFTLNMWCKFNQLAPTGGYQELAIASAGEYTVNGFRFYLVSPTASPPVPYSLTFATGEQGGTININTSYVPPVDTPVLLSIVSNFNGSPVILYADGIEIGRGSGTFRVPSSVIANGRLGINTISGQGKTDLTVYSLEINGGAFDRPRIQKYYNQTAPIYNKPLIHIPYPEWTTDGLLFTSGTWVEYNTYADFPVKFKQYGIPSFGVYNLNCVDCPPNGYTPNNNTIWPYETQVSVKLVGTSPDIYYGDTIPKGFNVGRPGGGGTQAAEYQGFNYNDITLGNAFSGEYLRSFPNVGGLNWDRFNEYVFTAWDPRQGPETYDPPQGTSVSTYYSMTGPKLLGPNAANPATVGTVRMEDYGQPPPPVNLPLITGIPSRYNNTGNTVSIAGYFSESLSDDQWQQLYSLLKTTLCKDQIP